jgi:VanZ family protein
MNILNKIDCRDLGILVILTFFTGIWCMYNCLLRPRRTKNNSSVINNCFINIPKSIRFLFPYFKKGELLNEKCFNMWAVGHSLTYFFTGLIIPNRYPIVVIMSILCEFYEYCIGYQSKLSDVLVNTFSYMIGSQITIKYLHNYEDKICKNKKFFYFCIPIAIMFLLFLYIFKEEAWD